MTTTPAQAVSGTARGPFAGLPREVAILSAVSFTVALGYGIVAPGIPAFARQFGVSVAGAATVISAFALMRVAFAMPAGRLVDRFGSRRVMAAGISGWGSLLSQGTVTGTPTSASSFTITLNGSPTLPTS